MNEKRALVTIVCALSVALPVTAAAAAAPLDQAKADLAKLTADAGAAEAAVASDASASNVTQLVRDAKAGRATLKADWKVLLVDVAAARKGGADKKELRSLLQAARTQVKGFRSAVRAAFAHAKGPAGRTEGTKGSKGKQSGQGSDDTEPAVRPQTPDSTRWRGGRRPPRRL